MKTNDTNRAVHMVASLFFAASVAWSQNFTTIDFPAPGVTATNLRAINPQGDIVGNYLVGGNFHGFLLSQGNFSPIDYPGSKATFLDGISPVGEIVS